MQSCTVMPWSTETCEHCDYLCLLMVRPNLWPTPFSLFLGFISVSHTTHRAR